MGEWNEREWESITVDEGLMVDFKQLLLIAGTYVAVSYMAFCIVFIQTYIVLIIFH
jgi:hypothetical protein